MSTLGARHRRDVTAAPGRRIFLGFCRVILAVLSLTVLVAAGYFHYTYVALDNGLHRVQPDGLGPPASTRPGAAAESAVTHKDGKAQNLLVIGNDSRDGLSPAQIKQFHVGTGSGSVSTDTLLIVHVPANGSRATLISIPRDTYVQIPGYASNKINAAYVDAYNGGADGHPVTGSTSADDRQSAGLTLLIRVLKNLTGLEIDHYVMVSFRGFEDIAKAIDGITVTLCHATDDSTAHNVAEGNGPVGSGFVQSTGKHDLSPIEALQFVRQRHNLTDSNGNELNDVGREARQRYFLAAAFSKVATAGTLFNPSKLAHLVTAVRNTLTIDLSLSLPELARQMLNLSGTNITGQTIPTTGSHTFPYPVGDALTVDPAAVRKKIRAWLAAAPAKPPPGTTASNAPTRSATSASSGLTQAEPKNCIN